MITEKESNGTITNSQYVDYLDKSVEAHVSANTRPLRVLITGASRGIGRAIALECARRGAIVGANFFRSVKEAETLQLAFPDQIRLLQFDVRDFEAVHRVINSFVAEQGGLDVLINNAGVGATPHFLVKSSRDIIEEIISVNLMGTTYCTKAALLPMVKARTGQIINISSTAANHPMVGMSLYAASKCAVEVMALNVAKEYLSRGIHSYGVRFGAVNTEMSKGVIAAAAASGKQMAVLQPEDVAKTIADLIFGITVHVTGSIISIVEPEQILT